MNISYARNMGTLYNMLKARITVAMDLSDILRAELVMSVSALDYYVHEMVELGVEEIYTKKRPPTSKFLDFSVSLGNFWEDNSVLASHDWLVDEVRTRHSFKSFQRPDNIADAIRLCSTISLWEEVSKKVGMSVQDVKDRLELIVDRRNKIAHEADADPTTPGSRWPINTTQVDDAVNFIERIGDAFFQILK
jgi:hypothetical protein